MLESLQKLFDTSNYKSKLERQDALFIYVTLTLMLILVTVYIFFIPDTGPQNEFTIIDYALAGNIIPIITILFFYSFMPFIYFSTRRGNLLVGGVGIGLVWYVLTVVPPLLSSRNVVYPTTVLALCIFIILSGLILHERGLIGGTLIALVTLIFNVDPASIGQVPVLLVELLGTSLFIYMYIQYAQVSRVEGGEIATNEHIEFANIATQISNYLTV